jgi:hypothetical protein
MISGNPTEALQDAIQTLTLQGVYLSGPISQNPHFYAHHTPSLPLSLVFAAQPVATVSPSTVNRLIANFEN